MITHKQLNKINDLKAKGWHSPRKIPMESGKTQIMLAKGVNLVVVNSHGHVGHSV